MHFIRTSFVAFALSAVSVFGSPTFASEGVVDHGQVADASLASANTAMRLVAIRPGHAHDCSPERQEAIEKAIDTAKELSTEAWHYLNDILGPNPEPNHPELARYTLWFGAYTQDRYQRVYTMFNAINNYYDLSNWDYYCNPIIGKCGVLQQFFTYAQCGVNDYSKMTICLHFWDKGVTPQERGSTLIHEASHFNNKIWRSLSDEHPIITIRGNNADDPYKTEVYGTKKCLDLAVKDPDYAVHNADNYSFFLEYPTGCPKPGDNERCTIS